jgi:hypothetical protein
MVDSSVLTIFVGIIGILFGTLISPYLNHLLTWKQSRKDILFKRKLEYFEKIQDTIESNLRLYRDSIKTIKEKKTNPERVIKNMKKRRKKFLMLSSPLYFNTENFSKTVKEFVEIEKNIFEIFSNFQKDMQIEEKKYLSERLEKDLQKLITQSKKISEEMKKELKV